MSSAHRGSHSTERVHVVDALRALALLGILSVNIWFFAHPQMLLGLRGDSVETSADQLVRFGSSLIFEGKSYVIFSFLFGLSFVLAWGRAHQSGASERRRSLRRFSALILLGLLHGLFLFAGDILLAYGVLGFILLGMRRVSARAALITAAVLYAALVGFLLFLGVISWAVGDALDGTTMMGDPAAAREAFTGPAAQWLGFQLGVYPLVQISVLFGQGPLALAVFLLGLVVGRARLIERIAAGELSTGRLLGMGLPALAAGLVLSTMAALLAWGPPGSTDHHPGMGGELLGTALNLAAGPIQAFGYVVLLLVLFRSAVPLTRLLAPAGRMSLTNYLTQSVVMVILFAGVGFGLAGELSELAVGGTVLAIWAAQLVISHLWFARFARGPLEAPLRAWTYAGSRD
ncbi:DUF418 domain-containing protein [Nesterenkonia alkaliphila]|uniref:DUF418 domain-containing protein n=1 Tax=Nesterenkonia alkaliphila TaxID=1463631 RepID=A0A7K1UG92_9MICC|nr:DUF418 domain-containing protein [Nesterenkonia alkaliphila]MVT25396.1 DUF418 domain-containing protein [Nesterenkonia alkaliphila]